MHLYTLDCSIFKTPEVGPVRKLTARRWSLDYI